MIKLCNMFELMKHVRRAVPYVQCIDYIIPTAAGQHRCDVCVDDVRYVRSDIIALGQLEKLTSTNGDGEAISPGTIHGPASGLDGL